MSMEEAKVSKVLGEFVSEVCVWSLCKPCVHLGNPLPPPGSCWSSHKVELFARLPKASAPSWKAFPDGKAQRVQRWVQRTWKEKRLEGTSPVP